MSKFEARAIFSIIRIETWQVTVVIRARIFCVVPIQSRYFSQACLERDSRFKRRFFTIFHSWERITTGWCASPTTALRTFTVLVSPVWIVVVIIRKSHHFLCCRSWTSIDCSGTETGDTEWMFAVDDFFLHWGNKNDHHKMILLYILRPPSDVNKKEKQPIRLSSPGTPGCHHTIIIGTVGGGIRNLKLFALVWSATIDAGNSAQCTERISCRSKAIVASLLRITSLRPVQEE